MKKLPRFSIVPPAFFAGILTAFTALCIAGDVVSRSPQFSDFVRFNHFISFETRYHPTARQVRETAIANLAPDPEKIAVVIGGSSILNGWGQRGDYVWSQELQRKLGDRFSVVNLAMAQTAPHEIGMIVAESILDKFPRLIFVADYSTGSVLDMEVDGCQHTYFFWDAYFRGYVPFWKPREDALPRLFKIRGYVPNFNELVLSQKCNALFNTNEFWNWVGYAFCSTVCEPTYLTAKRSLFVPRKEFVDEPYAAPAYSKRIAYLNKVALRDCMLGLLSAAQSLRLRPELLEPCIPESMRKRMIVISAPMWQRAWKELKPDEVKQLKTAQEKTRAAFEKLHIDYRIYQDEFPEEVFIDTLHFDEEGGRILAHLVAEEVRRKAKELGYD